MGKPFDFEKFTGWLVECGAVILPPTNPYEVLRADTCDGVYVIYRNKRGVEKWPPGLLDILDTYLANGRRRLSPEYKKRQQLSHLILQIALRDGMECWFSGEAFVTADDDRISIEHLLSVAHGGSNHVSNLVLATKEWNKRAGHLSVAEKVRLRDTARAKAGT